MTQYYSNPARETDPHALPDLEVFYNAPKKDGRIDWTMADEDGEALPAGWYWWACFPGCIPDSDPCGPFETEAEALEDARSFGDFDDAEDC